MNAIIPRAAGMGLISREDLAKSLNNAAVSMPVSGSGLAFMKMDKNNGDWFYGQEETLVEPESRWALNPMSIKHGWVAWDTNAGGAPVQEFMVPISRPLPDKNQLPELPPGTPSKKAPDVPVELEYQRQQSVEFTCIDGEDEGTTVEYKQSSVGAMKMFGAIINALNTQLEKGADEIVAIGQFKADPYKHKNYGKIFNPVFEIVEWRTMDDTSPADGKAAPTAEPVKEEPPARTRTRTAAPPPSTEADEEVELAKEYEAAAATAEATPRRRQRR